MQLPIRLAAVMFALNGVGFGLSSLGASLYLARSGSLPVVAGFRAFSGPFERIGWPAFTWMLVLFGVLSLLELLPAVWLWRGLKAGAIAGVLLSGVNLVFWSGFDLPYAHLTGLLRVLFVAVGWKTLR